jgi:hypothetical protein
LSALLLIGACSHADDRGVAQLESPSSDATPRDDVATPFGVVDASESESDKGEGDEDDEELSVAGDTKVISFEDEGDAGPTDQVIAPPKRKHIPSFELFGTAKNRDDDGPKMTLPAGVE